MTRLTMTLFSAAMLGLALPALAQIYTYKDESGRTVISDKPPVTKGKTDKPKRGGSLYELPQEPAAETAVKAAEGKPGVDPELEKRRKAEEAKKKADEERIAKAQAEENREACNEMKRSLALLESGQRVATANERGERIPLDDQARASEIARLKGRMSNCN